MKRKNKSVPIEGTSSTTKLEIGFIVKMLDNLRRKSRNSFNDEDILNLLCIERQLEEVIRYVSNEKIARVCRNFGNATAKLIHRFLNDQ